MSALIDVLIVSSFPKHIKHCSGLTGKMFTTLRVPIGGTILGNSRTSRKWNLAEGCRLLEICP